MDHKVTDFVSATTFLQTDWPYFLDKMGYMQFNVITPFYNTMSNVQYIIKHRRRYYANLQIPIRLQQHFGKTTFRQSLQTISYQ